MNVRNVTSTTLFCHRCRCCGEVNVAGFWDQLDKRVDERRKVVIVSMPCRACGLVRGRTFRLTAATRPWPRLCPWIGWGFIALRWMPRWVPDRVWRGIVFAILWLEARVKL